ncbi:hypothetical protein Tco_0900332 [Tanacetum coccineum]
MIMFPQAEDTEAVETNESVSTPPTSPNHIILFSETKSRTTRTFVRHHTPRSPSAETCIIEFTVALPSPSPPPLENIKSLKDSIEETMTNFNQGMSIEEIERVVAQRVANAIEAIAIYETKTNMARKSVSQTKRQEDKVAENASNKKKWEGNHNGSQCKFQAENKTPKNSQNQQQPNKRQNTGRAYTARHREKKL